MDLSKPTTSLFSSNGPHNGVSTPHYNCLFICHCSLIWGPTYLRISNLEYIISAFHLDCSNNILTTLPNSLHPISVHPSTLKINCLKIQHKSHWQPMKNMSIATSIMQKKYIYKPLTLVSLMSKSNWVKLLDPGKIIIIA
jgi:hypothetical protein